MVGRCGKKNILHHPAQDRNKQHAPWKYGIWAFATRVQQRYAPVPSLEAFNCPKECVQYDLLFGQKSLRTRSQRTKRTATAEPAISLSSKMMALRPMLQTTSVSGDGGPFHTFSDKDLKWSNKLSASLLHCTPPGVLLCSRKGRLCPSSRHSVLSSKFFATSSALQPCVFTHTHVPWQVAAECGSIVSNPLVGNSCALQRVGVESEVLLRWNKDSCVLAVQHLRSFVQRSELPRC